MKRGGREEIFFYTAAFLYLAPASDAATISGLIRDLDGNGINNVQVTLSGSIADLVVTDATGAYSFTSVPLAGSYVVTPSVTGRVFTPASRSTSTLEGDITDFNFTHGKIWTGAGADALASNAANWSGNVAPVTSDWVRFDGTNGTKGCLWNLTTRIDQFDMRVGFSTSVTVTADMRVATVSIAAGDFLMRSQEVSIGGNFAHTGGRFRAGVGGTAIWNGASLQTVSMVKTPLGAGLYDSYFANFRVQSGTGTVRAGNDLVIDETFNISTGRFESGVATHTLTGGTQSGFGGSYNWDDSGGTFDSGSGEIILESQVSGDYLVRQGGNTFVNLTGRGDADITFASNIIVNGNFTMGGSGSSVHLNSGSGYHHTISGQARIGPASTSGTPTLLVAASSFTFMNGVEIGTATVSLQGGRLNIRSSSLTVTGQGTLSIPTSQTGRVVFWGGTNFQLRRGTLFVQGTGVFVSSAVGVTRFSTNLDGTVNIQSNTTFGSMDINGMRMGVGSVLTNLSNLTFQNGATGGAAINFSPVTQSNITVDLPNFDASFSTNVRAAIDPLVLASADVDVIRSTGARDGPSFENDPSAVVNWGIVGTPSGFAGTTLGVSSITWSWTTVNYPYGFVVKSSTGGAMSPSLSFGATSWVETNLSTNTQHTRYVEAFTDVAQAASAQASRYTAALPASGLAFTAIHISSLTFSWTLNDNPAPTVFLVERSTNDVLYTQIASGTFASVAPYTDTGLSPEKLYYYRVKAQNGDGVVVPLSVKISTSTRPIPPPSVFSITPGTVTNLGTVDYSVTGSQIQAGARIKLKRGSLSILPTVSAVLGTTGMTATFSMTGAVAGNWDVEIENPDGKISIGSGAGILSVTNAASAGDVTIQAYTSSSGLAFTTVGNELALSMAANAMSDGRIYASVDPEESPLSVNPALIESATRALNGFTVIPGCVREVLAFTSQGRFSSGFGGAVSLSIGFPDQNHDGVLDTVAIRASTLQLITLNETNGTWQFLTGGSIDTANNRVTIPLTHFSVYALAGMAASDSLANARAYPSPWQIGSGGKFDADRLVITDLTSAGTIRIYSLGARLIKKFDYTLADAGVRLWDGRDDAGDYVKSGVYLIFIESSNGEKRTLKVGVER